jgi:hypothetical protein
MDQSFNIKSFNLHKDKIVSENADCRDKIPAVETQVKNFLGLKSIKSPNYLFEHMYEQTYGISTAWYKEHKKEMNLAPRHKSTFRLAMAFKINDRLYDITEGYIEYNGEKGLVVINNSVTNLNEADKYVKDNVKNIKTSKRNYVCHSTECAEAGSNAGEKVNLHKRIN